MGSRALLTFENLSDARPVLDALENHVVSFFPQVEPGCDDTTLEIDGLVLRGADDILANIDHVARLSKTKQ